MWSLFKDVKGKGVLGTIQNEGSSLKSCSQTGALRLNPNYCPLLAASQGWTAAPKPCLQGTPEAVGVRHWEKAALCSHGPSATCQSQDAMEVSAKPGGNCPQRDTVPAATAVSDTWRCWVLDFWALPSTVLRFPLTWAVQQEKNCLARRTSGNNI